MTQPAHHHIRFRGRSFPALAIEPEAPLLEWIERLDSHLARTPAFFGHKPIVVDITGLGLARSGVVALVKDLSERGIRILGLTGVELSWASPDLPPILVGGRAVKHRDEEKPETVVERPDDPAPCPPAAEEKGHDQEMAEVLAAPTTRQVAGKKVGARHADLEAPLVVGSPVRSGQSVTHADGDVTVVGSVASGAEIIAGGSIHVYGALRGRALAGAFGETGARIFCRRFEAELLAIGGVYVTADEIEPALRGQAIQAWLEHDAVKIARLD